VSELIQTLRAIIREELDRRREPALALVTEVFPGDGSEGNHQASVRLRESGLELQRVPVAVARPGLSLLPRVDDLVLVVFAGGDVASPVVVGALYHSDEQPPEAGPLELVYAPGDDEDDGVRRIHVETPGGGLLTIDDGQLVVERGGTKVIIAQDGDVTIESAAKVAITSQGEMSLKSSAGLVLEATSELKLKAPTIAIEADAEAKVKGASVALAGITKFSAS
jgi:phage baseplate assembly protein gpV